MKGGGRGLAPEKNSVAATANTCNRGEEIVSRTSAVHYCLKCTENLEAEYLGLSTVNSELLSVFGVKKAITGR